MVPIPTLLLGRTHRRGHHPSVVILTQVDGMGALIARSQQTFRPERVHALIVVAGALSLLVHAVLGAVESYAFRIRAPLSCRCSSSVG